MDVAGLEPATPCLQSRLGKTLNAFAGVAYTETRQNSRSSNVPKLSREFRRPEHLTRNRFGVAREESVNTWRLLVTHLRAVVRACLGGADHFRLADHPPRTGQIRLNESAADDIGGRCVVSSHTEFRLVVLVFSGIRDRERTCVTRRKTPVFGWFFNRYPVHCSDSRAGPLA